METVDADGGRTTFLHAWPLTHLFLEALVPSIALAKWARDTNNTGHIQNYPDCIQLMSLAGDQSITFPVSEMG